MHRRWATRVWPLVLVALVAACEDDKTPAGAGGGAGAPPDAGPDTVTPPPGDGGLVPCLDLPTDLDRPPSGVLPCELVPPGFKAP
jgi:hypothetical protein